MTDTDRSAFGVVFGRVSRTFNRKLDAATCSDYFEALQAVPIEDIEAAAVTLVKSSRFFPKPVDWLEAAQRERRPSRNGFEKFTPPVVLPDGTTETSYHCHHCQDTGWRPGCGCDLGRLGITKRCPGHPYEFYGQPYPEPLKACSCRPTNRAWLANHESKYATARSDE